MLWLLCKWSVMIAMLCETFLLNSVALHYGWEFRWMCAPLNTNRYCFFVIFMVYWYFDGKFAPSLHSITHYKSILYSNKIWVVKSMKKGESGFTIATFKVKFLRISETTSEESHMISTEKQQWERLDK